MIIVSNAGTHPEPARLAAGMAREGVQVLYGTSGSFTQDSLLAKWTSFPLWGTAGPIRQVRRRMLPQGLTRKQVRLTAPLAELRYQYLLRRGQPTADQSLENRTAAHRAQMARMMRKRTAPEAIVAQFTSALDLFERAAPGVPRILMYPIAHHDWVQKRMEQEAATNPEWASFLQGYDLPARHTQLLDQEISWADHIVVPSNFVKQTFIDSGVPATKMNVLLLGADPEELLRYANQDRIDMEVKKPITFLFAGQVNQRKGISYVLDAFDSLDHGKCRLLIVGHADAQMKDRIRHREGVVLLPPMPRPELGVVMNDADALLMPSLAEGFGLTALEAMTVGTLPVVSPYTFASDLLEHGVNGYVVEAGSVLELRRTMQHIIDYPQKARIMGERARTTARSHTWDRYESDAVQLIKRLVAGR